MRVYVATDGRRQLLDRIASRDGTQHWREGPRFEPRRFTQPKEERRGRAFRRRAIGTTTLIPLDRMISRCEIVLTTNLSVNKFGWTSHTISNITGDASRRAADLP